MDNSTVIRSVSNDQYQIIKNILALHVPSGVIDLDPTFSKGIFYERSGIAKPRYKFDLFPRSEEVKMSDASCLPMNISNLRCVMYDPPFIVGHTKGKPTGIIGERFHGFPSIALLWKWYSRCISEFNRVLALEGILIIKCQDVVSSGKQHLSHVHLITDAQKKRILYPGLIRPNREFANYRAQSRESKACAQISFVFYRHAKETKSF